MMHPLQKIGFVVATIGAGIVGLSNLLGLGPLAGLGMMFIVAGMTNFMIGSFAASARKKSSDAERTGSVSSQPAKTEQSK